MTMTEYMILRGAGEALTDNLPAKFMAPLLKPGDTVTHIAYPASIGPVTPAGQPSMSMDASRKAGVDALADAIERTNAIPVPVGYSLGAYVVSDYLEALASGKYSGQRVAGAIQIASPRAPKVNYREGLARAHGRYPLGVSVCEVRNFWDIICNTPSTSPLMKMTGIVAILTGGVADGFDFMVWLLTEFLRLTSLPSESDLKLIRGYAAGTAHASEYLSNPVFREHVAEWISSRRL